MEFWKCVQASETPNTTQLDDFYLDVKIEERVKTGDKMKNCRVRERENYCLQWKKMQNFHNCQRLLGKVFIVDIMKEDYGQYPLLSGNQDSY